MNDPESVRTDQHESPVEERAQPEPESPKITMPHRRIRKLPFLLGRTPLTQPVPVVLAENLPHNWEKRCYRKLRRGDTVYLVEISEWLTGPGKTKREYLFLEGVRQGYSLFEHQFIPPAAPTPTKPEEKMIIMADDPARVEVTSGQLS